jgi:hypothetical protein
MTRDDIIRMAREVGFDIDENHDVWITDGYWLRELERFANLVAAAEREACAKLMGELTCMGNAKECFEVAATYIRARGQQ